MILQGSSQKSSPTINGATEKRRTTMMDESFFDEKESDGCTRLSRPVSRRISSIPLNDDVWEISVAERKPQGKRQKTEEILFTLYVTTAITSLTLTRTKEQLLRFDHDLQSNFSVSTTSPLASLLAETDPTASPPRKKKIPFFATLQRTLSPSKIRTNRSMQLDIEAAARSPLAEYSTYLSAIARVPDIKKSVIFQHFFSVQSTNDLESHRVERRVRRMKSDSSILQSSTNRHHMSGVTAGAIKSTDNDAASLKSLAEVAMQFLNSNVDPQPTASSEDVTMHTVDTELKGQLSRSISDQVEEDQDVDIPPRPNTAEPSQQDLLSQRRKKAELPVVVSLKTDSKKCGKPKTSLEGFCLIRVLGKGCAGKVLLVRHNSSRKLYAMKAIHKHHVLAHRELGHTLTEQSVLKRMTQESSSPFIIKLWWSFHNADNLFLVLDFHPGGDLAYQLSTWGRLGRDRCRFYSAEIAEGLSALHEFGVIYRDLKPENILIAADGHIVLTDFGLSKQFSRSISSRSVAMSSSTLVDSDIPDQSSKDETQPHWMKHLGKSMSSPPDALARETCTTFCGTAEYLAPEVLLGEPYSYECDAWSLGTMLYEMLIGVTPFFANDHTSMYRRVLSDELVFDDDGYLDADTKSIIRGLLQKNPLLRMTDARIKRHPYFSMIDWNYIRNRRYIPPYIPPLDAEDDADTSNFDKSFLAMTPVIFDPEEDAKDQQDELDEEERANKVPQSPVDENGKDVFCGYSFRGPSDDEDAQSSLSSLDEQEEHENGRHRHTHDDSAHGASEDITASSVHSDNASIAVLQLSKDESAHTHITERGGHAAEPRSSTAFDVAPTQPPRISEEEEWEQVEKTGLEANNGARRRKGGTLFARGVHDKYVLAVREVVRPTPKRSNSQRRMILPMRSRKSSQSSSLRTSIGPDSPSLKRSKLDASTISLTSPLKMRMKSSRTSLGVRRKPKTATSPAGSSDERSSTPLSEATVIGPLVCRQGSDSKDESGVAKSGRGKLFAKRVSAFIKPGPINNSTCTLPEHDSYDPLL